MFSILLLMLFSVSITYGYLGRSSFTGCIQIPPLADNPSPTYMGDRAALFARSWCAGVPVHRVWEMHFQAVSCEGDFCKSFFRHLLLSYWKDVLYKARPPPWARERSISSLKPFRPIKFLENLPNITPNIFFYKHLFSPPFCLMLQRYYTALYP